MKKIKIINEKVFIEICILCSLVSCSPPETPEILKQETPETQIKIVSLSQENKEVVIISSESLDMSNYVLRQGETKNLYSLSGIHLEKEVPQKISVPSHFLRKKNNSLSLSHLEIVSTLEEI